MRDFEQRDPALASACSHGSWLAGCSGVSFAEVEDFCTDLMFKDVSWTGQYALPAEILECRLRQWKLRFGLEPVDGNESNSLTIASRATTD